MKRITESGMVFQFPAEQIFQIEGSALHRDIGEGIKTVEFIACLKDNELDFIEAKSSSPRPTKENQDRFEEFISEIADKFIHSFNLYISAFLGRHDNHELTGRVGAVDNSKARYKFILIIKGHQIDWLLPLKDALEKKILHHRKIWQSKVILMNEEIAQKYKLVRKEVEVVS